MPNAHNTTISSSRTAVPLRSSARRRTHDAMPSPPADCMACVPAANSSPSAYRVTQTACAANSERAARNEDACASSGCVGCETSWYATGVPVVRLQTRSLMSLKVRAVAALVSSPVSWAMIYEAVV